MAEKETKQCPFCGEEILAVAIKCKHCGSNLQEHKASEAVQPKVKLGETYGNLMLVTPFIFVILCFSWVASLNMLQNPASKLQGIAFLTILATAIFAAIEANKLGIGSDSDIDERGRKRSGPIAWFAGIILLWIICYPAYLKHRSKYGVKSRLGAGIAVALIFCIVFLVFISVITAKQSEIKQKFGQLYDTFGSSSKANEKNGIITYDMYNRIKNGMSYDEVVAITGQAGKELSRTELAGYTTVMYSWQNPGGSNMMVMFQKGKVIQKSQFGLK